MINTQIFNELKEHFKEENGYKVDYNIDATDEIIIEKEKFWCTINYEFIRRRIISIPFCDTTLTVALEDDYISIIQNIFKNMEEQFEIYLEYYVHNIVNNIYNKDVNNKYNYSMDLNKYNLFIKDYESNEIVVVTPGMKFKNYNGDIQFYIEINRISSHHPGQLYYLSAASLDDIEDTIKFFL